jgi:hypothetical protein
VRSQGPPAKLLATLVLVLCAVCITAAPAVAAPSLSWSGPTFIDGDGMPSAIACPSSALCVAVDNQGNALTSTDPATADPTWSLKRDIDSGGALSSVSCPSSALCVAVDDQGNALTSTDPSAGPAASWSTLDVDRTAALTSATTALNGVSCASAALCVAVDNRGDALISTDPSAGPAANWSAVDVDGTTALSSVSCPSVSLCVAVDAAGNVLSSGNPLAGGSSTWQSHDLDFEPPLVSVSCTAAELCVALDGSGDAFASVNPAPASGRPTWSSTMIDTLGNPTEVSCAASGLCVAVDGSGYALASDAPALVPPAWLELDIDPTRQLVGVACVSEGFCVAVDTSGHVLIAHVPAPAVATGTPSEVTQTGATLTGTVDSYDAILSGCQFEYGSSVAYGLSVPCASLPAPADAVQSASAPLPELVANTTYHYRLVITSPLAGTTYGLDQTFTTLSPSLVQPHPSISGTPAIGQHLTCKAGVGTTTGVTLSYAWLRDLSAVGGASGSTYVVGSADVSHHLQCRVTARNAGGSATATSAFVTVPAGGLGAISESTVGTPRMGHGSVSVPLTCSAQAAGSCTIALRLTIVETLRGSKILAVAAARTRRATVAIGASAVHLKPGQQLTATVSLNATGRRLLAHYRHLAAELSVTGTVVGVVRASLKSVAVTFSATAQVSSHRSRKASVHGTPAHRASSRTSSQRRR